MAKTDDLSGIPRYLQIARMVESDIRSGRLEPGNPAPSRNYLAAGPSSLEPLLPARKGGSQMSPVPVMITAAPPSDGDDISFIDDVDSLGSAEAMLGCGDDNPYN